MESDEDVEKESDDEGDDESKFKSSYEDDATKMKRFWFWWNHGWFWQQWQWWRGQIKFFIFKLLSVFLIN